MMFDNLQSNPRPRNLWDDVIDFLGALAKDGMTIAGDVNFYNENHRVLNSYDVYEVVRRIGRTEERYSTEITILNRILEARDATFPPRQLTMQEQIMQALNSSSYYHIPTSTECLMKYRKELENLTNNIPLYAAMKYGKEKGQDWIMDSIGNGVKEWFYKLNGTGN